MFFSRLISPSAITATLFVIFPISAIGQSVSLIGTELSLRTQLQLTPTSELAVSPFPASVIVSETEVEFPDVESLFGGDPVPPGFGGVANVAIDAGADFLEIDFANSAPDFQFASAFQNTYVFTFDSAIALQITDATIDDSVTTLGLTPDRLDFAGNELFINVQSLTFNPTTFARINLNATAVPEPSSCALLFGVGMAILTRRRRRTTNGT